MSSTIPNYSDNKVPSPSIKFLTWEREAHKGLADAQFHTGLCYEEGNGVKQSYTQAFHYYTLAAEQGHVKAQLLLARLYEKSTNNEEAFHYYALAAQTDVENQSIQIEVNRFIDRFIQQTPKQAFRCFQIAAHQNDPLGFYFLAECFLKGIGTTTSIKKAFGYYQLASHNGYFCNLRVIAKSLFDLGISKKMIARLLKSIISNRPNIQAKQFYDLAKLFAEGKILLHSSEASVHFYTLSAQLGYTAAQRYLGDIYLKGLLDVQKNEQLAVHYYLLSNKITCIADLAEQHEKNSPEQAFAYYQLIYNANKVAGAKYLGHCYEKGIGVRRSLDQAISYYKVAYESGLKSSCYDLGRCLEKMKSNEALSQAIHYYQLGAQQNSYNCQYRLAELFEKGKGLSQSFEKAFNYYSLAANNGSSKAWFQVGRCLANGIGIEKSDEKAFKAYELSGSNESQYQLAICYLEGKGVIQSLQQAKNYLISLAKKGMSKAYLKLAKTLEAECQNTQFNDQNDHKQIFSLGKRFEILAQKLQDRELAHICFRIAGDLGSLTDVHQQFSLALYYDHMRDYQKAFEFLKKAANQHYELAQYALGRYFQQGKGCTKSWDKAVQYYILAANQGNAQAFYELGVCYERGLGGLERSYQYAFENFKLSADQKYAKALCALGLYYEMGRHVEKSFDQAFCYFKLAAEQNNAEGQYHVGRFYRLGRRYGDVLLSLQEALNYYQLALEQGYRKAFIKDQIKRCQQLINKQREINAACSRLPSNCVIFPRARKLDIRPYLKDRNLLTLRKIFRRSRHQRVFLEGFDITMDEAQIIREGMLENSQLTFICPQPDIERIYLAFELVGYHRRNIRCLSVESFSSQIFGLLFVGTRKPSKQSLID